MNFWWSLGAYALVAVLAGGLGMLIGYSRGVDRERSRVSADIVEQRFIEDRTREHLQIHGLTGNLTIDARRQRNRADAERWLQAIDGDPERAREILTAVAEELN